MQADYVCFDIETTGLNPVHQHIIEIGAVKVKEGKIIDSFSQLIRPDVLIPEKITEITHITSDMVQDAPNIFMVLPQFLEFCEDNIIMGHNLIFDYGFIKQKSMLMNLQFEHNGIDTLHIARKVLKELKSKSLGKLCEHFGIINAHAHRAYDDAMATYQIYEIMKEKYIEEYPEVFMDKQVNYSPVKEQKMTGKQEAYLNKLIQYHKIKLTDEIENYTKSRASYVIDKIILHYGKIGT